MVNLIGKGEIKDMDMLDKEIAEGYIKICQEMDTSDVDFSTHSAMVGMGFQGFERGCRWVDYTKFKEFLVDPETYVVNQLIIAFKEHILMLKENIESEVTKELAQGWINELEDWLE